MKRLICYCFGHSEADIRLEVLKNTGVSNILEEIIVAKKNGSCRCDEKHPAGR